MGFDFLLHGLAAARRATGEYTPETRERRKEEGEKG